MKLWRLILIGVIAAFELSVLVLILNPNVSDRYRAFFIDKTTDCWPEAVSGEIRLGQPVSLLKAGAKGVASNLLVCGWLPADENGTWSEGPESRLLLQLPREVAGDVQVELKLLPFTASNHPLQRVAILANEVEVAALELTEASSDNLVLSIPDTLIGRDGRLELAFVMSDVVSLRELGLSLDRRKLGIRLLSLVVRLKN